MKILTSKEASQSGIAHSVLRSEGHGAFGEPDNSYDDVVYVGKKRVTLSDNDLIIVNGESPNREVIQVLSVWQCSDKLLEIYNPKALEKRYKEKLEDFNQLKKEIKDFFGDITL